MESKKPEVTEAEVPVVGTTPKDGDFTPKEKREIKELVIKIAGTFLVGEDALQELRDTPKESFLNVLQEKYEEELRRYYKESGLQKDVQDLVASCKGDSLDVEILQLMGKASDGDEPWVDMLTKLRDQYPKAGMNCTLASAMLHLALDDVGEGEGVHTASGKGHVLVLRELSDGGIRIYDTTRRRPNERGGYESSLRSFASKEVQNGPAVDEGFARSGCMVSLKVEGSGEPERYYAYDSKTKLNVAIALNNLALISIDANGGETRYDEGSIDLVHYRKAIIEYVMANNTEALDHETCSYLMFQHKKEADLFLADAERYMRGLLAIPPNPFDYVQDPQLARKGKGAGLPDPKEFPAGISRRQRAKELCEQFPELVQFSEIWKLIEHEFFEYKGHYND